MSGEEIVVGGWYWVKAKNQEWQVCQAEAIWGATTADCVGFCVMGEIATYIRLQSVERFERIYPPDQRESK